MPTTISFKGRIARHLKLKQASISIDMPILRACVNVYYTLIILTWTNEAHLKIVGII